MYLLKRSVSTTGFVIFAALIAANAFAQKKKLTYKQVYEQGKPKLLKSIPDFEEWIDDKNFLLEEGGFRYMRGSKLIKVNTATGKQQVFIDFEAYDEKLPEGLSFKDYKTNTDDYEHFIFLHEDNLHFFSRKTDVLKQLTDNASEEKNPKFSPDGKFVAFTRDSDLYIVEIESGQEKRLTHDGSETVYNGWASWVYFEEIFSRSVRFATFWWSPNSEMIVFLRFDDSPVPKFYITHTEGTHDKLEIQHYPKSGDPNPYVRLGIAHISTGNIIWVDTEAKADHYVAWPFWTPDSKQLFFQWMNRGQDHIKIYTADPFTGEKTQVYEEKQSAWVDFFDDLYIFKNGSGFLLRSDVDGWRHLYYYDMSGKLKKRLTHGDWRVRDIHLVDEKNRRIYFHGFRKNSTENHLFSVDLDGKNFKKMTKDAGFHRCNVSPKGKYFVDAYSNIHQPTRMELYTIKSKHIRTIDDSKLPSFDEYDLGKVEMFTIPSGDGYDLPAVWTLPPDFDESKTYPVIFSIYGGPNSGRVYNRFGQLSSHYLAQNGIIVISVDHRSSGHFGKKGVSLMHRSLGKWEMHDLIAAVKWLRQKPFIDPDRIGITGGSYGGYTTCMALTYGADYFTHGIARASVTDWKLYDTVYTERYMDTPQENPDGYRFGSVMTHAEKLKGKLLLTHGSIDDNVHMQNTIQLIDKLENLGKDYELNIFPNQRHGIRGKKRIYLNREAVQFWFKHFLNKELSLEEIE